MSNNGTPQDKRFRDTRTKHSIGITLRKPTIEELILQLGWIAGIQDQIEFANSEALIHFQLELTIIPRAGARSCLG
jgi:hypothetical protein